MANPQASLLSLTVREQSTLSSLQNKHSCPQQLVCRIEIIRLAADGATNTAIADKLRITRNTVRLWRDRWIAGTAVRAAVTDPKDLHRLIAGQLTDVLRPGAPSTFTPQQQVHIVAIACEDPKQSDRPISHWSEREIADEAIKRGIVPSISQRQVGRFKKRSQFRGLRNKTAQSGAKELPQITTLYLRSTGSRGLSNNGTASGDSGLKIAGFPADRGPERRPGGADMGLHGVDGVATVGS